MRQAFGAWQPGRALQLSPPCLRPGPTLRPACAHSCCAAGCFRRRSTATAEDSCPTGVLRVTAAMPARIEERSSHGPTPLAARLEWAGFAPLQPPQTPEPVVAIARDEQHGDLMDFFWAAVARGELSQRVLDLTGGSSCSSTAPTIRCGSGAGAAWGPWVGRRHMRRRRRH